MEAAGEIGDRREMASGRTTDETSGDGREEARRGREAYRAIGRSVRGAKPGLGEAEKDCCSMCSITRVPESRDRRPVSDHSRKGTDDRTGLCFYHWFGVGGLCRLFTHGTHLQLQQLLLLPYSTTSLSQSFANKSQYAIYLLSSRYMNELERCRETLRRAVVTAYMRLSYGNFV